MDRLVVALVGLVLLLVADSAFNDARALLAAAQTILPGIGN